MSATAIRPAIVSDVAGVQTVIRDAYGKYVERIGRPPAPMAADYEQLVAEGVVWILELDGEIAGLVILRPASDHLLVSNVAVSSRHQGRGLGALLLSFRRASSAAWIDGIAAFHERADARKHRHLS